VRVMLGAGIPLVDAVKMASETPARLVGATHKGTLDTGKDADIVIFNENIDMQYVIVGGRVITEA
jgi:N-acetylglucosamine-6-phosphate deacetylase